MEGAEAWFNAHCEMLSQAFEAAVDAAAVAQPDDPLSFIAFQLLEANRETQLVPHARHVVTKCQLHIDANVEHILKSQAHGAQSSRSAHLRALQDVIGAEDDAPALDWEAEWAGLVLDNARLTHPKMDHEKVEKMARSTTIQYLRQTYASHVDGAVALGWPRERAETVYVLKGGGDTAMAKAIREGRPTYARSTYKLSEQIFLQRQEQQRQQLVVPITYASLGMRNGVAIDGSQYPLWASDRAWLRLEAPDRTGFRGLTCSSILAPTCKPECFTSEGFMCQVLMQDGPRFFAQKSDVVGFISAPDDEHGCHAAVMLPDGYAVFPPNTLYRLKETIAPGEWEAPGGVFPQQRLLLVTATYRAPHTLGAGVKEAVVQGFGKLCGVPQMLEYGSRRSFVAGIDDLLSQPVLTMADEFERDITFVDQKGVEYRVRDEWAYACGSASVRAGCTPGTRDENNDGKTLTDFVAEANARVSQRRASGYGAHIPEAFALLTEEEVLAVRLYTGPCYQLINDFLRQVAKLSGAHRRVLAQHPRLTFSATVQHLCNAIRKLAAVTKPEEAHCQLYRAVRGVLPASFWVADAQGMVCAVETAFMSTSRNREVSIEYLGGKAGVLWTLHARPESDSGFHYGADVSLLSQFGFEEEILYPPCTLLEVREHASLGPVDGDRDASSRASSEARVSQSRRGHALSQEDAIGSEAQACVCISVLPCFV